MKTKLPTLILALFSFTFYAQETYVPDDQFEAYLEANTMGNGIANDNYVTTANINTVENLGVASLGIMSLEGIEGFTALKRLTCNNNSIETLDLSANTNLEALYCHYNNMTSLTLPDTPTLYDLQCYRNNLTTLNVSNNEGLKVLFCYNNLLNNTLDASSCTILENLDCGVNQLDNIILPNDSNTLFRIECDNNNISSLNVSNNYALTWLKCDNNSNLLSLDLQNNIILEKLYCYNNPSMSGVLLPSTYTLTLIDAFTTGLTTLDASGLSGLNYLRLNNSYSLTSLTLPNTSTLQTFWMYGHALNSIDFTPYTNLYLNLLYLDISNGNLTTVDVSMLQNLEEFYCIDSNNLTGLNINNNNNNSLLWMYAYNNPNLTCIQVDNVAQALAKPNWSVDNTSYYNTECTLGTEDFNLKSISIYPNPVRDHMYIDLQLDANYTLTNMFGQKVNTGMFNTGINELATSTLVSGVYLLNLETDEGFVTKKIIKD